MWSEQALPSTISTPPVLPAGIPGVSPTSLLVSPHGTFLRRFGTRATWHAQYRLVCDGLSFLWFPPLSDGAAAPPRPRGRAGAAITEGRQGWNHRWHHWHSQWFSHQNNERHHTPRPTKPFSHTQGTSTRHDNAAEHANERQRTRQRNDRRESQR